MELHPREKSNPWKVLREKNKCFFFLFFCWFSFSSLFPCHHTQTHTHTVLLFVRICIIEMRDRCSCYPVNYDDNSLFKYYVEHLPCAFRWRFSGDSKRLPLPLSVLSLISLGGSSSLSNVASKTFSWWYDILNVSYGKWSLWDYSSFRNAVKCFLFFFLQFSL